MKTLRRTNRLHWLAALLPLLVAAGCTLLLAARPALAAPRANAIEQSDVQATDALTFTVEASVGIANQCVGREITVTRGTEVYTCYTITNSSPASTTIKSIAISEDYEGIGIAPQSRIVTATLNVDESFSLSMPTFIPESDVAIVGHVAAFAGAESAQVNTRVTVNVINPALTVRQTLSTSPSGCTNDTAITVPSSAAVYRCITLTNTGDVDLGAVTVTVSHTLGAAVTYTLTQGIALGQALQLTHETANAASKPAFTFAPASTTSPTESTVRARAADVANPTLFSAASESKATVNVGTATTVLTAAPNDKESCATNPSLSTVTNTAIHYCLRLNNTGNTVLTRHLVGRTGQAPVPLDSTLAPGATLVITSGTLAALGLTPLLGPEVVTANVNTTFVVTSSALGGFQFVASAPAVSVLASTPTWTPTSTWTPIPTATPWPTWTPWPVTPTWTPWPTWTPIDTPPPPTPTWTRSFELSNLQTPTPRADFLAGAADPAAAVDFQATALAQSDPNAFLTPDFAANPPFDSGLPTPVIDASNPEQAGVVVPIPDTETPTIEPTRTPLPTQTPTPTATPTATQRPIVYAAPAPPPGFGSLFVGVLDSTMAAAGILFVTTGAVVFFAVLATVLALGFLRNSRRPYELHETDEDDPNSSPSSGANRRGLGSSANGDRWPTSLP